MTTENKENEVVEVIEKEVTTNNISEDKTLFENKTSNSNLPYIIIIILLVIIAILSFFLGKNYEDIEAKITATNIKDVEITVLTDSECPSCYPSSEYVNMINSLTFLSGATITEIDYQSEEGKELYANNQLSVLPAILVNTDNVGVSTEAVEFNSYLQETSGGLYYLEIGSSYDPTYVAPVAEKADKPVADLFIMSYCPYGLQAQKGYLEVMSKLGDVADINVKFVNYVMHGQQEADENVVQYCIQKEQEEKYTTYLNCFLDAGENEACRQEAGIDEDMLSACISDTDETYNISENMANAPTDGSGYPKFTIYDEENNLYGVQGSPTFVLNGTKLDNVGRDAQSFADLICDSFNERPEECDQEFQDITFDSMFGFTTGNGAQAANSGCGQ